MKISVIILIVLYLVRNYNALQECRPEAFINCSITDAKRILVNNSIPIRSCSMTKIGDTKYIFDPVNITKMWITFVNKDIDCDNASMTKLTKDLNLPNVMIILLDVQAGYLRLILASPNNSDYLAVSLTPALESNLKNINLTLSPVGNGLDKLGKFCFNGGVLDNTYKGAGQRCSCPPGKYFGGQRCEYLDRSLTSASYYFNVFRKNTFINLSFSLSSNGINKNQKLLTIKDSRFTMLVELSYNGTNLNLETPSGSNSSKIDSNKRIDNQKWYQFYLDVSTKEVRLNVPSLVQIQYQFPIEITESFMSHYLVLREDNLNDIKICLKNVKVDSQILDLNSDDNYESCCWDRCKQRNCKQNEDCLCVPYVSDGATNCFCKIGFEGSPDACRPSMIPISQIETSKTSSFSVNDALNRVDCQFRTRSTSGTLLYLLIDPTISITVKIVDAKLNLVTMNQNSSQINYNISDGEFHNITLNISANALEMILDDSNYGVSVLDWGGSDLKSFPNSTITIGPLIKPWNNTLNTYSTCFSAIRINGASEKQQYANFTAQNEMTQQCSRGKNCGNDSCIGNEVCDQTEWQNTKCICKENFTFSALSCIFYKCVINPCQNNGVCAYAMATNDYYCKCVNPYFGKHCEDIPAAASLWWIAILVVLLLLLIILVVLLIYCCCYRKRKKPDSPSINKIHENTVIYNDQAGECDYNGPPINYDLMKAALYNKEGFAKAPVHQTPDLIIRKTDLDKNNIDLVLDHPLEYGYEGYNSDNDSVSSLGSKSTNSQLNTLPLDNSNNRFNYLNDLYK